MVNMPYIAKRINNGVEEELTIPKYDDLTWSNITNKPTAWDWANISNKPSTYAPATHNHNYSVWLASQCSYTGWIGFYSAYGGTRKGWIGHDGSTPFQMVNEAGSYIQLSATDIYCYSSTTGTNTRHYYRRGDVVYVKINTAGYVTTSGTSINFTVPFSKQILGTPAVTAASVSGFIIRQGNKYCFGSSSSAFVSPSSYTCELRGDFVNVNAVFGNSTNVTNNDSIGIYWDGRITFS